MNHPIKSSKQQELTKTKTDVCKSSHSIKQAHHSLTTSGTPTRRSLIGPEIGPLAQAGLSQNDSTSFPQFGHYICLHHEPRSNPEVRKNQQWCSYFFGCYIILHQYKNTMQHNLHNRCLSLALMISLISLVKRIRFHFYDSIKHPV